MEGRRLHRSSSATRAREVLNRRFPDRVAVVDRLIKECERFRELCDDYLECGKVLRRFEELGDTTQQRIEEYEDLQTGLEQELLECIEDRGTCTHCGRKHGGKKRDR